MVKCCLTRNELVSILKKVKGNLFVHIRESNGCFTEITGVTLEDDSLRGKSIVLRTEGRYLLAESRPMKRLSKEGK